MKCYEDKGHMRLEMKRASVFIASVILIAVLLLQPIFAYSYDKNYLDYSSWDESNINAVAIDSEGAMGELSGSLNYFTEESSAYFLFNLNESGIDENSTISVIFSVSAQQISYDFTVEGDNVEFSDEASEKYFNIESKSTPFTTGHAIVTVVMDIKDKIYLHNFAIKAAVDGRIYNLLGSDFLKIETYPTTTSRASSKTTKKQTTKKSSSKTTTKKSSSKKSSSKSTTKKQTTKHYEEQSDEGSADFSGEYLTGDLDYMENSHFSHKAKAVLIGGLSIIGAGIVLFAAAEIGSAVENKKKNADENKTDNKNNKEGDEKIIDDE